MEPKNPKCGLNKTRASYIKAFVNYKDILDQTTSKLHRKRFTKYVHKITVSNFRYERFINNIKHVKLLHSGDVQEKSYVKRSRSLKALKPLTKHIKHLISARSAFFSYFLYVSKFKIETDKPGHWRMFSYLHKVTSLKIYLPNQECRLKGYLFGREVEEAEHTISNALLYIEKYRCLLSRSMIRRKSIKCLNIHLKTACGSDRWPENHVKKSSVLALVEKTIQLLQNITPYLKYLTTFTLVDEGSLMLLPSLPSHNKTQNNKQNSLANVLRHVTHLRLPDYQWSPHDFARCIDFGNLQTLVDLSFGVLDLKTSKSELRCLTYLGGLKCLKRLDLVYNGVLDLFLKTFTLPKSIESLRLELFGFDFKTAGANFATNPNYLKFFERCKGFDGLTDLSITILESPLDLAAQFSMLMVKQLPKLRIFKYYLPEQKSGKPLSPESFKTGVKNLKSLKEVYINTNDLNFITTSDMVYKPKLKEDPSWYEIFKALDGKNLVKLWQEFSDIARNTVPVTVNIGVIYTHDRTAFLKLFNSLQKLPSNLVLKINQVEIQDIEPGILSDCLCNFFSQTNMQGTLFLRIHKESVYSYQNLDKIVESTMLNLSLKCIKITIVGWKLDSTDLTIQKGRLIEKKISRNLELVNEIRR